MSDNSITSADEQSGSLSRVDSSESIVNKCDQWTLNNDSRSDHCSLESMGLSVLTEHQKKKLTDASRETKCSPQKVDTDKLVTKLQELDRCANQNNMFEQTEKYDAEFFVFKRRRIDIVVGEDHINKLPDEHLLMIFNYLNKDSIVKCAQVCKRWRLVCFDEALWKRLDLGGKVLKPGSLGRALRRGVRLLRLAKAEIYTPIFWPKLQYVSDKENISARITHLDLSMAAITPEGLEEVLEFAKKLVKVSLEHCTLSPLCLKYLAKQKELDTLNLAMCYNVTGEGMAEVFAKCPRLEQINVAWTSLSSADLNLMVKVLPVSVQSLNISGCRDSLFDCHLHVIGSRCKEMVHLDISDAMKVTTGMVVKLAEFFPALKSLGVSRCYGIGHDGYYELRRLRGLRYLEVFGVCNDAAIDDLNRLMPLLKINTNFFSYIARPTVGLKRTSIWNQRVRD